MQQFVLLSDRTSFLYLEISRLRTRWSVPETAWAKTGGGVQAADAFLVRSVLGTSDMRAEHITTRCAVTTQHVFTILHVYMLEHFIPGLLFWAAHPSSGTRVRAKAPVFHISTNLGENTCGEKIGRKHRILGENTCEVGCSFISRGSGRGCA